MGNDQPPEPPSEELDRTRNSLPLGAVVRSVLAAAFGVQSARNKQRDFSQGNYRHFVVAGIVFTILFVLTLLVVVNVVLGGGR